MRSEQENNTSRVPLFRGWLKSPIAQILVLALIIASLPAPVEAAYRDNSGNLPGMVSNGTIIGIVVAGGAAIGLLLFFGLRSKGKTKVKLETPPVKFDNVAPGQPTKQSVPVTNIMNEAVTVKAVTVDDKSGAFAIGDARQVPFTLAPGEKFEIPVTLSANNSGGKARLRIVATTAKLKKDAVKFIDVSYGHKKSKLGKLIPGR